MLTKKYQFIYLAIFLLVIILSSSVITCADDININMTMYSRRVRLNIYGNEREIHQNWYLNSGIYAEGYLSRPDKFYIQPDPLNISYKWNSHTGKIGYFRPRWGSGHFNSIMLTGNAPALPGLYYSGSLLGVDYEKFAVNLGKGRGDFFGHRLQRELWPGVKLGLKETVIYSDTFPGYWLNYVPFYPHYLLKYIPAFASSAIDNMNVGLDCTIDYWDNLILYGDLHVTEWPLLPESKQPPTYGLQGGLYYEIPGYNHLDVKLEYQRLMNYLYSARVTEQYYQYQGYSLGSDLGPDSEQIKTEINYRLDDDLTITGGLKFTRKGEGEIGDYWSDTEEARENLFLSGIVEEGITPVVGFSYKLKPDVMLKLNLEVSFINNFQHEPGNRKIRPAALGQVKIEL